MDSSTRFVSVCLILGTTLISPAIAGATDLQVALSGSVVTRGKFLNIVSSNDVMMSGSNTVAGTVRVVMNGDDAVYNVAQRNWSKSQNLLPGMNRFFIAALSETGEILASTNEVIVYQASSTTVTGTLGSSTVWSNGMGVIHVTGTVSIPAGKTLTIAPGTIVLFASGTGISVTGGSLLANGTVEEPIFFGPLNGTAEWGPISGSNSGGNISVRHAEAVAGRFSLSSGASLLLEDSILHHYYSGSMLSGSGGTYTLRRLHLHHYHDSNMNSALVYAEDCLIEDCDSTDGDPFEMSDALNGTFIQRITLRRSSGNNADAFDLNSGTGVTYINNLVHDVSDKGFSIGTAGGAPSRNITVSNNLVWNAHTGIAIKDGSTANVIGNTIVDCAFGIQAYPKYSSNGGHLINGYNNILWNNGVTLVITNGSMVLNDSDLGGSLFWNTNASNLSGTNNLNIDPLFFDATTRDYRLAANSPVVEAGRAGANMGVIFPIGGLPGTPLNLAVLTASESPVQLVWDDDADNESAWLVERSVDAANWLQIQNLAANSIRFFDTNAATGQKYYYRVRTSNASGNSEYSNIASGTSAAPVALKIDSVERSGTDLTLHFTALAGQTYTVQARESFDPAHPWANLSQIPAQASTGDYAVSLPANLGVVRFYRIATLSPPE